MLKMARDERPHLLIVLNRVPPRSGLTDRIAADLAKIGAPVASTRIGNRVALVRAMSSGLGVTESLGASPAAGEISALADEVCEIGKQGRGG
jgi:chromosome partitioning protein